MDKRGEKFFRALYKNQGFLSNTPTYACVLSHFSHVQLCDPTDCSPPGSIVHGILQARILEWVVMPSSKGSSQLRN